MVKQPTIIGSFHMYWHLGIFRKTVPLDQLDVGLYNMDR